MDTTKRKRGRPSIYSSSAERSKAWRERQKTRTAVAEFKAISSMLREFLWLESNHTRSERLFENAPRAATAARDLLALLAQTNIPPPETEQAFLENVARYFDGVTDIVSRSILGAEHKIALHKRAREKIQVLEMGNQMARLVKRARGS